MGSERLIVPLAGQDIENRRKPAPVVHRNTSLEDGKIPDHIRVKGRKESKKVGGIVYGKPVNVKDILIHISSPYIYPYRCFTCTGYSRQQL